MPAMTMLFRTEENIAGLRPGMRIRFRFDGRLARKIQLVIDLVTAFSSAPLRWCAYLGAFLLAAGLALVIAGAALLPELGGGILIVLAVFVGLSGVQLVALAIVGEYVWSALSEARRRPQYVVEAATDAHATIAASHRTMSNP